MVIPGAAPAARPPRPLTVTVASALQLAAAVVLLAAIVLLVTQAVIYDGLIDEAAALTRAAPEEVSGERAFNAQWALAGGGAMVIPLVAFAGTAFPVRAGRPAARVVACAGAGVPLLCCAGCGALVLVSLPTALTAEPGQGLGDPFVVEDSAFYDRLYALESESAASWLPLVTPVAVLLVTLTSAAFVILLLTPASNRYFRRPVAPVPLYPPAFAVRPGDVFVPFPGPPPPAPPAAPATPPAEPPATPPAPPAAPAAPPAPPPTEPPVGPPTEPG